VAQNKPYYLFYHLPRVCDECGQEQNKFIVLPWAAGIIICFACTALAKKLFDFPYEIEKVSP
jgi:hypothetical protein